MAFPTSSPPVWATAWDLPHGPAEETYDSCCLLQAQELAVVQAMAQEIKAWGLYGQGTGFSEPSPPMPPMYDGQQQPIQTITQTEPLLARGPAFHYTDAAQCALTAELPSYPLIDPELLRGVSPVSSGPSSGMEHYSVDQYGSMHHLAQDHQLLDVTPNDYVTISVSMNQPLKHSNTALNSPIISDAFLDDTPPSSPERSPTPPRILPGVYELGGPSGPRPLLPRTERSRTPPPRRRRGNEHATHIQPWGCGVCKTAFMTPHLLRIHQRFHEPAPEFYELVNPAFSVQLQPSEAQLKAFSEENERFSARMRCANGEWTSWRQSMHCFGDVDEDSGSELG